MTIKIEHQCPICGAEEGQVGPCNFCIGRFGRVLAGATSLRSKYKLNLRMEVAYPILFSCCRIDAGSNLITLFDAHRQDSQDYSVIQVLKEDIYLVSREMNSELPQPPDLVAPHRQ